MTKALVCAFGAGWMARAAVAVLVDARPDWIAAWFALSAGLLVFYAIDAKPRQGVQDSI